MPRAQSPIDCGCSHTPISGAAYFVDPCTVCASNSHWQLRPLYGRHLQYGRSTTLWHPCRRSFPPSTCRETRGLLCVGVVPALISVQMKRPCSVPAHADLVRVTRVAMVPLHLACTLAQAHCGRSYHCCISLHLERPAYQKDLRTAWRYLVPPVVRLVQRALLSFDQRKIAWRVVPLSDVKTRTNPWTPTLRVAI